jgi:pre-mRNA-processing factor 39
LFAPLPIQSLLRIIVLTNSLRLFERGAECVGLDFLAHPFWDKYLDFEERNEAPDRIFAILSRVIHIPMHQYARYFERYRGMAANRPVQELAPDEVHFGFRQEITEGGTKQKSARDIEQELRARLDSWHLEIFQRTQTETTKRWTYEQEIKRPYFHVTELDDAQLANWKKYLDFEEAEGDYVRTKFLYERCLVTTANYEEFWMRYARWMFAQPEKQEEVRNIYQRASCLYVPISQPTVRLYYAQFEEAQGRPHAAVAIYEAILDRMPDHVGTIISLANVHRRQYGVQSAIEILRKYIDDPENNTHTRGALASEWARLVWKVVGSPVEAQEIYVNRQQSYPDSYVFWNQWLDFEIQQPTSDSQAAERYARVKSVFDAIRNISSLPQDQIKLLAETYFAFLKERGGQSAMKEFMQLDREINGPASVTSAASGMHIENGKGVAMNGQQAGTFNIPPAQHEQGLFQKQMVPQAAMPLNGGQPLR